MAHAVILAHPRSDSVNGQIAGAYARAAASLGEAVVTRDLYALGFDPRLTAAETVAAPGASVPDEVARERAALRGADVFCLVYPLWFNGPPAIMKGYVDRVLGSGFGFESDAVGGTSPLLDGRRLISFTTSGAPDGWVRETGALETLMAGFDRHVAAVCGLSVVDHVNFGGVTPGITEEAVADILARVEAAARADFGPGSRLA